MSKTFNIKVSKEVADLICVYCKLNHVKMVDFCNSVFEEKFKGFKEKVKELSDFKVEP